MIDVSDERFDELVDSALARIPDEFADHMKNVVILVRDYRDGNPRTLGLYEGVSLPRRQFTHTGYLPDTITLYRGALMDYCVSEAHLEKEIYVTVMHEVGHYFGMSEEQLHELGWG
ncbi:metallopeptidase family protein [Corynebacterium lowii]|uniref:Possibl zinc metallo-peptidase n=1 Tax=Corynebacterium lowii TaxID=1544413 RepID=A0A0Q1A9K8_9CORY|nr:metallopeptidase family protein [Corynebacterium lowii]KQB83448.1 Possibl zinc metallo-peptidase [Corynebacterium lowii]MDP9852493.1 putative Zn-dependent protease with MMP-like domain [Corynebacterium lowii]